MSTVGYTGIEPGIKDPRVFDKPRICSSQVEEVKYSKTLLQETGLLGIHAYNKVVPQSLEMYDKQTKYSRICLLQILVVCPWHFAKRMSYSIFH